MIPNDPIMLLSFTNMKLRDFYPSLDAFCEDLAVSKQEIEEKMGQIGYVYDAQLNKFR